MKLKLKILLSLFAITVICASAGLTAAANEHLPAETAVTEILPVSETTSETTTITTTVSDTAVTIADGWLYEDEKQFYYQNGKKLTGYQIIDDKEYFFAANGTVKGGFQTINGIRMYFSYDSFERQFGWIEYNGDMFYLDENGKAVGRRSIDGRSYIFSDYGACQSGWIEFEGCKYYSDFENGLYTGEQVIDGQTYIFSSAGRFQSGWVTVQNKRIFYDYDTLEVPNGFIDYNGNRYYCDSSNGKLTGDNTIDGIKYRFDTYGCQQLGFQKFSDGTRYYSDSGQALKGFITVNSETYYLNNNGLMQTGFQTIAGKKYYFDIKGVMQTGWQTINDEKYYIDNRGVVQTGLQTIDGKKYYFDTKGVMQTGWQTINGEKYYIDNRGVVQTGLQTIDSRKYYFNTTGVMQTGWQTINGKKYYFDKSGVMYTGWQKIDGKYYFLGSDGALQEKTPKVFVGIGHGGIDPGAVGYIMEKEFTFKTGQETARLLTEAGIEFMLSRDADIDTTMESKLKLCNDYDPDLIIDIHFNAVGGSGFEVYHSQYGGMSLTLAQNIDEQVSKIMKSNGCKIMLYPNGTDRFTIIRETHAPAVLLEGGFVDNYNDAEFIRNNYKLIAKAYVEGILKTLDIIMSGRT